VRHTDELGFYDSRNEDEDGITRMPQLVFLFISQMEYYEPFDTLYLTVEIWSTLRLVLSLTPSVNGS
jgi:hypothetical protein